MRTSIRGELLDSNGLLECGGNAAAFAVNQSQSASLLNQSQSGGVAAALQIGD